MGAFRYGVPLILPDSSDVRDRITNEELTYLFNAFRTLATYVDEVTGALSPLRINWSNYQPAGFFSATSTHKIYALCSAAIAYGAMVNFQNVAGVLEARPAQASGVALVASGFCNEPGGFGAGEIGEFICGPGINTGISGLVIGNWYYLDPVTVTGQVTAVQPVVPGQAVQVIGQAIASDKLLCGSFNTWRIL